MGQEETDALNRMMLSVALSRALCSIADLGIADQIRAGEPRAAADLARAIDVHGPSLHRVLRFLSSHGLFRETEDGRFDHTPLSSLLRSDAEGSFRPAAQMFHYIFRGWDGLDYAVRTGKPGFDQVFGKPAFDFFGAHPELAPILDAAMTSMHGRETAAMLDAYDFSTVKVLADIGGGNGSLIAAVLQRYPQMRGILCDLGAAAERSRENLELAGVSARCQVIEGSFFETIPAGADTYLFRHIIHDWPDDRSLRILRNCLDVIPDRGRLLLVECVIPAGNGHSISKYFDMAMMAFPGGLERTESQFRSLLKKAGFELTSITPTATMVSIIEAQPLHRASI